MVNTTVASSVIFRGTRPVRKRKKNPAARMPTCSPEIDRTCIVPVTR